MIPMGSGSWKMTQTAKTTTTKTTTTTTTTHQVRNEINEKDAHDSDRQRKLEDDVDGKSNDLREIGYEDVSHRLPDVLEGVTTFFDAVDERVEVLVDQHHVSGLL